MQIPSVASQLQSQLIQNSKTPVPQQKPQALTTPTDADGDHDGDTATSDNGKGLDIKG